MLAIRAKSQRFARTVTVNETAENQLERLPPLRRLGNEIMQSLATSRGKSKPGISQRLEGELPLSIPCRFRCPPSCGQRNPIDSRSTGLPGRTPGNPVAANSSRCKFVPGSGLPMYVCRLRSRRLSAVARTGLSSQSRVAALAERRCSLTTAGRPKCPCRSMESTKLGNAALSRLPQIRSEASQTTMTASRTASS